MIVFVNAGIYSFAEKIPLTPKPTNTKNITPHRIHKTGVNVDAKNTLRFLRTRIGKKEKIANCKKIKKRFFTC
jgi:hypothetical protein